MIALVRMIALGESPISSRYRDFTVGTIDIQHGVIKSFIARFQNYFGGGTLRGRREESENNRNEKTQKKG